MAPEILVNTGSCHDLLPDGTKPSLEPMLAPMGAFGIHSRGMFNWKLDILIPKVCVEIDAFEIACIVAREQ